MSTTFDLRGLDEEDLGDLKWQIEKIQDIRARLGTVFVLRPTERERGLLLTQAIGHLSVARLEDLDTAADRLLALDGLVSGEAPLEGLSDDGLLQRLGEIVRVLDEEGISRLPHDGGAEDPGFAGGVIDHRAGIPLDAGRHEPGDEGRPQVHDLREFLPAEGDGVAVPGIHPEPPVPRRATPPP
ncbi:hypothetical protein ABLE91_17020 [Aquabacter sp. CN5-332]|uniref:hypothetical protein n=1 Tax=Aquabacter sp. CN5-332 TaxID=3156608 RepID=UPI0032B4FF67